MKLKWKKNGAVVEISDEERQPYAQIVNKNSNKSGVYLKMFGISMTHPDGEKGSKEDEIILEDEFGKEITEITNEYKTRKVSNETNKKGLVDLNEGIQKIEETLAVMKENAKELEIDISNDTIEIEKIEGVVVEKTGIRVDSWL